ERGARASGRAEARVEARHRPGPPRRHPGKQHKWPADRANGFDADHLLDVSPVLPHDGRTALRALEQRAHLRPERRTIADRNRIGVRIDVATNDVEAARSGIRVRAPMAPDVVRAPRDGGPPRYAAL